ncbi:MAG TPA: DEAD/DEAH box helicase [Bacillota bacterium]|nr:DEAD/DEAH box helicase [Bacillota bacterium]
MNVYDRYAPFIREYIYRSGWDTLRAIQSAAGEVIFGSDDNLLLSAPTASGKTEAAFFPILTLFEEDMPRSVGAIYIGPLKALINDQFTRLNALCAEAGIPVWHWHGDVAQSHKNKLIANPSGILQITPESLEALLLHRHADIARLFGDLRFVVIDEIHSLMRADRGSQTMCLIERLSYLAGVKPRRIGLSATIGDLKAAGAFLSAGSGRKTAAPQIEVKGIKWRLSMEHFYVQGEQEDGEAVQGALTCPLDDPTDSAPEKADGGIGYIFEHTRGKKCLVFVNSREECETVTATLRQYCEKKHEPDRFLIHHGNLSASYRETAEDVMKDDTQLQTTVTTATLELGIDIGRLERAFQIDAPYTVSSFLQRMGRTGRRGMPPEMWFVIREDEAESRAMLPFTVPWKLLQAISLVQLYIEDRYVEPPRTGKLPYSLLYHQTMCTLASCGEMSPAALASRVLTLSCFIGISQDDFKALLRHLLSTDQLEKTPTGGLIVGLAGERQLASYKFYAVFKENEEYTVRCDSQELGTVVSPPPVGEKLALAGHVWVVEEIDRKKHLIYVAQVKGIVPAFFGLCPGDINTRVLERMKRVLAEDTVYPYMMKNAALRLAQARNTARASVMLSEDLVCLGGDMWCLFPWLGTYAFLALERFIKLKCASKIRLSSFDSSRPYFCILKMKADRKEFFDVLYEAARAPFEPEELLYPDEVPLFEKYDEFLPVSLVCKGFCRGVLGIAEMKKRIEGWYTEQHG